MLGTQANINTITSQQDYNHNQNTPNQPESKGVVRIATTLKVLFAFIILQLLTSIAVLVLKIVFKFFGFDSNTPFVIDQTNCSDYSLLFKYQFSQGFVLRISFVMIALCVLLTIILLIITIKYMHASIKLPSNYYTVSDEKSLTISTLYIIIGPKMRALMYILQSICLLSTAVVLGYYLIYYLNFELKSCKWVDLNTTTYILVVWAISAGVFVFGWVAWIIIVVINIKNRADNVEAYLEKSEKKEKYEQLKKNTNETEVNQSKEQQNTRNQLLKPEKQVESPENSRKIKTYGVYEPQKRYDSYEQEDNNKLVKVRTLDSEKQYRNEVYNRPYEREIQKDNRKNYLSPKKYESKYYTDQKDNNRDNPVFSQPNYSNQSPYSNLRNSKYYEGQKPKLSPPRQYKRVYEEQKQKQFKRSRFNEQPKAYDQKEDNDYLKSLSRQQIYSSSNEKKILPEANMHSPKNYPFEGGKSKLHNGYFKQENNLTKKNEGSDGKKKRRGILNDYIRGKYTDN